MADHVAVRVDPVAFGPQRQFRVQDRQQRRVLDLDGSRAPPSGLGVVGRHYGDCFALVAHLVDGQDGLVGHLQAVRLPPRDVLVGQDATDTGDTQGGRGVDGADEGARVRAPYGGSPDHGLSPQV